MSPNNPTDSIGIFDSGFGGLTVMRALVELLPFENILYLGDTARLPYGSKSAETIRRYTVENALFLAKKKIKLLVIACNTSSSTSLKEVQSAVDIPVIGITQQGIEETLRRKTCGKIAILATRATIASGAYQEKLHKERPEFALFPISCPLFVPLVEEGLTEHPITTLAAQEYLSPLHIHNLDAAILGCTHYPLLTPTLQKVLGSHVELINPAEACAEKTKALLASMHLLNPSKEAPRYQFFVTDDPQKFCAYGTTFLGRPIEQIQTLA